MRYGLAYRFLLLFLPAVVFLLFFPAGAFSQCPAGRQLYDQLISIEKNTNLSPDKKLTQLSALQQAADSCKLPRDSVYARLLHRTGVLKYSTGNPNAAISYTLASLQINTSGRAGSNLKLAVNSYYNLGYYYSSLKRYKDALTYFDLCTLTGGTFKDSLTQVHVLNARREKAHIYYQTGDYQKAIEEAALGIQTAAVVHNPALTITLLDEQAQACASVHQLEQAIVYVNKAEALIGKDNFHALADNFKTKATISEAAGRHREAMGYHEKAISARSKTGSMATLANDYLDAGNTVRTETINKGAKDYSEVIHYYTVSLQLAQKSANTVTAVKAMNNLAAIAFRKKDYRNALAGYHTSLQQMVTPFKNEDPLGCPTYRQCNAISDENFLSLLLANKAECLLYLYRQTTDRRYLTASLNTALLNDSIITDMRHGQSGEQSKLYWRAETRDFFTNAMEACYSANDAALALYFMEKSRAVLLNDKLNELGAAARLPPADAAEEQKLQINVFWQQQKVAALDDKGPAYKDEELKLFAAKEALQRYINTLQAKYPAYYQYKYADAVPRLPELQNYLAANGQSFVDYFISDTAVYLLAVTPSSFLLLKQSRPDYAATLSGFLKTCSDIQTLNSHYERFAAQAYAIYQTLFQPLALPKGRVVVCYDAVMVPFEALTTDADGKAFLIRDYSFSYVYAAQALLKKFANPPGKGNFLGVAPVSYAAALSVPPLKQSGASVQQSSAYYTGNKLITGSSANRNSLLSNLPGYTIVAILSHARADSTDKEPVLFMADSVIRLSELQLLRNPSTELIVLSACQTNVGKLATGEGVFSLTRGFASAGIPAITATLWKADEETIYNITQLFLKNVAGGMRKDDALQQAKLSFMHNGSNRALLPYYWANMILAGNGEPVTLAGSNKGWWIAGGIMLTAIALVFVVIRRKSGRFRY